jgi:trimethylamine--corrinoid protein Co-methyltransferase
MLSPEAIPAVVDEAMEILSRTGVVIEETETLEILRQMDAGIDKETNRVRLGREMVESALGSAPKHLKLHDLRGNEVFTFGDGGIHFDPGSAATFILDAVDSVMRKPTLRDVADFTRLTETLEHIDVGSTGVIPSDVPEIVSDSMRLYLSCLYSDKPVVTGTFTREGFAPMRDLLLARAGTDSLRDRATAIFDVCPSAPLRWSPLGCHDLRECAQSAIPVQFISMPMAGALAPMSLLANVVQHAAETLAGIVIHQAWTPGSPVIWGGSPVIFDMRYSTSPVGAVETMMVDLADAEVGRHLGLPTQVYLGMSDAKTLDAQAGMETAMTLICCAASTVDLVSGPGMLNFENCQCLEKLVLDNDICGMARRFQEGLVPRGETLGRDAIQAGLDRGDYLTTEDTLCLYRQEGFYPSGVIDRKPFKEEGRISPSRLIETAHAQVKERLGKYRRPAIDDSNLQDMKSVMEKVLEPHGVKHIAAECLEL